MVTKHSAITKMEPANLLKYREIGQINAYWLFYSGVEKQFKIIVVCDSEVFLISVSRFSPLKTPLYTLH